MNKRVKEIYNSSFHKKYEKKQQHMYPIKQEAIDRAQLTAGDRVAIFGCGTGMEFSYILDKIGSSGHITGIDYSSNMLSIANEKIVEKQWTNIDLKKGDIREITLSNMDCIFCTLCLSIISEWNLVINNLINSVKKGGLIVIGDMQLAKGWRAIGNPISVLLSKEFGGTFRGHTHITQAIDLLKDQTEVTFQKTYLMDSYVTCISKKI